MIGSGVHLEPCEGAVKRMDGKELFRFMDNGSIYTLMGKFYYGVLVINTYLLKRVVKQQLIKVSGASSHLSSSSSGFFFPSSTTEYILIFFITRHTISGRKCLTLIDNETKNGGDLELQSCQKAIAYGDGR